MSDSKKFVIMISAAPYTSQAADSALAFCKAAVTKGHKILQVFLYHDGVYLGSSLSAPEQTERKITQLWVEFSSENKINLVVCSNSAVKRGILDWQMANQFDKHGVSLNAQFRMAGLGQFVEAVSTSDRVISFVR